MKTKVITLVGAVVLAVALQAGEPTEEGQLKLCVTDLESNRGEVRIALFNSEKSYTKTPVRAAIVKIKDRTASWSVEGLESGTYAIALFHDEDGDGKMERNLIGMPKEDYGFSNNASGSFGPPSWKKARFTIGEGVTQHIIKLSD